MKKILLAMSGGVDSSAAAVILKNMGYDVVGATMKLWGNNEKNIEDAKKVCERLQIPFYVFDYAEEFENKVIKDFLEKYKNAKTPNPCIVCNKYLKFGRFLEKAREMGIDYIATGHYAKIRQDEVSKRYILERSNAGKKDQTYVLYNMTQEILSHTIFPLGDYENKDEIRKIAEDVGLDIAKKPDSQEICFIPDNNYAKFIENRVGKFEAGNFVDLNGKVLGKHGGIIHYTVGQRKGLGISSHSPLFVVKIDKEKNEVIIGEEEHIYSKELMASDVNYIAFDMLREPISCKAKIRYSAKEANCVVYPEGKDSIKIVFDEPQRAITSGQAVVLYDGNRVIRWWNYKIGAIVDFH